MKLNDISFARNFNKQTDFKSKVDFLLSFNASNETLNCNFAVFCILFEDKSDIVDLLKNKNNLAILINCYPSCFETIIRIDSFRDIALNIVKDDEKFRENYNLLINSDYSRLKANLKTLIESSTKSTRQTQLTFF